MTAIKRVMQHPPLRVPIASPALVERSDAALSRLTWGSSKLPPLEVLRALDQAVFAAYGWPYPLPTQQILANLLTSTASAPPPLTPLMCNKCISTPVTPPVPSVAPPP